MPQKKLHNQKLLVFGFEYNTTVLVLGLEFSYETEFLYFDFGFETSYCNRTLFDNIKMHLNPSLPCILMYTHE